MDECQFFYGETIIATIQPQPHRHTHTHTYIDLPFKETAPVLLYMSSIPVTFVSKNPNGLVRLHNSAAVHIDCDGCIALLSDEQLLLPLVDDEDLCILPRL